MTHNAPYETSESLANREGVRGGSIIFLILALTTFALSSFAQDFVRVEDGQFMRHGKPYYYVGTNFWAATILASEGAGGNRERLCRELDTLKELGIDNLRILAGADEGSKNVTSLSPCLQTRGGELNDTLLQGLDYLLAELEKRDMLAVIYLTNSWDWSGGFGYYLRETGHGDSPDASGDGWNPYCDYASQFYADSLAVGLYQQHVRRIVSRRNSVTGRLYRDEPAIMAWQLCNEPRPFRKERFDDMLRWSRETARMIKRIDPNHLVTTGSEGTIGCLYSEEVCEKMHADRNIDYMTLHIWPINWGWASRDRLREALPNVYLKAGEYLETNLRIAENIGKPLVIEEFGYSRDNNLYSPEARTTSRDAFYNFIFQHVSESFDEGGYIAGCNFWAWAGEGRARATVWEPGDDLLGDPPHEPQGWYSVFDSDSTTLQLIQQTNAHFR